MKKARIHGIVLTVLLIIGMTFSGCSSSQNQQDTPDPVAVTDETNEPEPAPDVADGDLAEVGDAADGQELPNEADNTQLADDSKLVMATEATFPPYEYYAGTDIAGVDVDIAREIASELGKELVIENMDFGAIIPAVKSGKAHFGAAGMSITPDRLEQVDFSIEYATSRQVIMTKNDSDIMEEADLEGKVVGVQLGTVADQALSEDSSVQLERYSKYTEIVMDLMNGRVDAIVLDFLTAQELAAKDENLVVRDKELFTDVYAFCVQKGDEEMLQAINSVMERLIAEGKIEEFTLNHSTAE